MKKQMQIVYYDIGGLPLPLLIITGLPSAYKGEYGINLLLVLWLPTQVQMVSNLNLFTKIETSPPLHSLFRINLLLSRPTEVVATLVRFKDGEAANLESCEGTNDSILHLQKTHCMSE